MQATATAAASNGARLERQCILGVLVRLTLWAWLPFFALFMSKSMVCSLAVACGDLGTL